MYTHVLAMKPTILEASPSTQITKSKGDRLETT